MTAAEIETTVRDFAKQFPTANTARMISLCESGAITWDQAYGLAHQSLTAAMSA